jgi:hypothetical protein
MRNASVSISQQSLAPALAFAGVITFDGFFLGRIETNALAGASLAFPWVMMSSVSVDRRESSGRPQAASSKRRAHPFARSI